MLGIHDCLSYASFTLLTSREATQIVQLEGRCFLAQAVLLTLLICPGDSLILTIPTVYTVVT